MDSIGQHSIKDSLDLNNLPLHIAIIMDGNGRWAKKQGEQRIFGHHNGVHSVRDVSEACAELGVSYLTLYAFSTENWNRPKEEVHALMTLLVNTISDELPTLHKNKISLECIGDIGQLPEDCQKTLAEAIAQTKEYDRMKLILALSYSAKWDIINAVKSIATMVKDNQLALEDINNDLISAHLSTAKYPDPSLMIRTSGEHRVSNFLLWELAYAEFYFSEVLWPDFHKEHLYQAIFDYQKRERRFGLTSDQIVQSK